MRYDTQVYFQRAVPGEYDETTGDYNEDSVEETMKLASVVNTDVETIRLLYGTIKQDVWTISLQRCYTASYDRIRIGDKLYHVDRDTKLRTKQVLIVSGV